MSTACPTPYAVDLIGGQNLRHPCRKLHVERAGVVDVRRVLSHGEHTSLRFVVGDEVDMRQLGDRMTDALVDAAGDVAALDMRERQVQIGGRHRDRELLESIAADDDDVRVDGVEAVGELERGETRRLRHRHVVSALDHVQKRSRDVEPARLDIVGDVTAVLVEQNRASEHQLELDLRVRVELADQQLTASVIRAARDRKADSPLPGASDLARRRRQQCGHMPPRSSRAP